MNLIPSSILSIAPGRGRLGVATFRDGRLIYYGVKSLRQFRSNADLLTGLEKILSNLCTYYCIRTVIMPLLNKQQRHSAALICVEKVIEQFARRQNIAIHRYDPMAIRRVFCPGIRPTKANTSDKLVEIYPELIRYRSGESDWELRYYGYLFSAIAGGKVFKMVHHDSGTKGTKKCSARQQSERTVCN
ncbi:MAG: hypothetical protein IPL32_03865 [Chloracidobacterium sp.]|nr:hypothetical protein [Chloracidobacterium sp.]